MNRSRAAAELQVDDGPGDIIARAVFMVDVPG